MDKIEPTKVDTNEKSDVAKLPKPGEAEGPIQRAEDLLGAKFRQLESTKSYTLTENNTEIKYMVDSGFKTVEQYVLARMNDIYNKVPETSKAYVKLNFTNILKTADLENLSNGKNGGHEKYPAAADKAIRDTNALYHNYMQRAGEYPVPLQAIPAHPPIVVADVSVDGYIASRSDR